MSNRANLCGVIAIRPHFLPPGRPGSLQTVKFAVWSGGRSAGIFENEVITGIVPTGVEWAHEEHVVPDLVRIVESLPRGTRYIGYLEGNDEYQDLWRVYIVNGKPVVIRPTITWPEVPGVATA